MDSLPQTLIDVERLRQSLILVVDDVEMNRKILAHSLKAHHYHNVITAADGAEALKLTQEHRPDLVILDLMMPGMDGFAYLQAIQQDDMCKNMPVLVQTALSDMEKKLRAFELGAADYICKPVDPGELSARTYVHLTQKILTEDLCAYKERVTNELNAARLMQQRLMPATPQVQVSERVFDMKIASYYETSSDLGGDCWGMRPLSDHRLAVYMYDFSGHGITSAMNVFRMHTIMQEFMHAGGDPGHFLAMLNRHLHPLLERDEFATMFYGIIDTEANCLLYASAAAPSAIMLSHGEPDAQLLGSRGFPLGVIANASYETKYTPFAPGDMLLLYSDCLIETQNAEGKLLDETYIKNMLVSNMLASPQNPAQACIDALMHRFRAHSNAPLADDMTLTAYWRCKK